MSRPKCAICGHGHASQYEICGLCREKLRVLIGVSSEPVSLKAQQEVVEAESAFVEEPIQLKRQIAILYRLAFVYGRSHFPDKSHEEIAAIIMKEAELKFEPVMR